MTKKNKTMLKLRLSKLLYPVSEQNNKRVMHCEDVRLYKRYWEKHEKDKERDFGYRL